MSGSRWVIGLVLVLFVAASGDASAGVFKPRGGKTTTKKTAPAAAASKKQPTRTTATTPRRVVTTKAPAKKGSRVATKGRPNDLTPDPSKKGDDVVITEDEEEDVIVRDD